jgi:hypothetical protein
MWVVPLGFVMSFVAFYVLEAQAATDRKMVLKYGIVTAILIAILSFSASTYFVDHPSEGHHGHEVTVITPAADDHSHGEHDKSHDHKH